MTNAHPHPHPTGADLDRRTTLATLGRDVLDDTRERQRPLTAALAAGYPDRDDADGWQARRSTGLLTAQPADLPPGVVVDTTTIAGVPVLTVTPAHPIGGFLHLHGGGWSMGSHLFRPETHAAFALATGLRVVSVGYRLCPEHTLGEAIEDCVAVAGSITADGDWWAIGGESAGAHLSVATLLALRDQALLPFGAALLSYGVYDLAGTPGRLAGSRGADVAALAQITLDTVDPRVLRHPRWSPLHADLSGLPPARFVCGTDDGLLEDTVMMAARWDLVAEVERELVAGAEHAFTLLPGPATERTLARDREFLVRHSTGRHSPDRL